MWAIKRKKLQGLTSESITQYNKTKIAYLLEGKCLQNAPQYAWQHFLLHIQMRKGLQPNLDVQLK